MAGNGCAHNPLDRTDGLCVAVAGLSDRKVRMRLPPDRNSSCTAERGERKTSQTQHGPGLCFRGSLISMRSMDRGPEQQARQADANAATIPAAAPAAQQTLAFQVAQKHSEIA